MRLNQQAGNDVLRRAKNLLNEALFRQLPEIHHGNVIGKFCHDTHIVG